MSLLPHGWSSAAEQRPITAIDQGRLGVYEVAVAGAVSFRHPDRA